MAVTRRKWSPDEKREVLRLAEAGYTQPQIAEKLRPGVKTAWRSVGQIIREERSKQTAQINAPVGSGSQPQTIVPPPVYNTTVQLPDGMADSLTAKEFMLIMNDDQRAIFVATYEDLRGDADEEALTRAENEMLIRASYSNVKYLRAQTLLHTAETYLMMDLDGELTDADSDKAKRRMAGGREGYKKEVEQWHKEYMELINDLKLTRKQRLDKIKDTRNTFLDLQTELTDAVRRDSLVEEIKRINHSTIEELHKMSRGEVGPDGQKHSWLIGAFEEFVGGPDEPLPPGQLAFDETKVQIIGTNIGRTCGCEQTGPHTHKCISAWNPQPPKCESCGEFLKREPLEQCQVGDSHDPDK